MRRSREINRVMKVIESDRTGITNENLSLITGDIERVIDNYFERKGKTIVYLNCVQGEYKLAIEVAVNSFKTFSSAR